MITADSDNSLVGNFSCTLTTLNPNTVQAKLPSSFHAEIELTTGSYTAVYTYYPTPNFTQPNALTLTFQITVRASPCCIPLSLPVMAVPCNVPTTALVWQLLLMRQRVSSRSGSRDWPKGTARCYCDSGSDDRVSLCKSEVQLGTIPIIGVLVHLPIQQRCHCCWLLAQVHETPVVRSV